MDLARALQLPWTVKKAVFTSSGRNAFLASSDAVQIMADRSISILTFAQTTAIAAAGDAVTGAAGSAATGSGTGSGTLLGGGAGGAGGAGGGVRE